MFEKLLSDVFPINRTLLGKANNQTLEKISKKVPLCIHKFPSGQKIFDWVIPKEWVLKKATLRTKNGKLICDASKNILRVVKYSDSYSGELTYQDILPHLHFCEKIHDAIPYRTSYYDKNWGFCLTKKEYDKLDKNDTYIVDIEAEFINSFLQIGELKIPGKSKKEIVLTSYTCHPNQVHDGLSGVFCLLELYQKLSARNNNFTYRFFFLPETIGPIALLANNVVNKKDVDLCLVCTCVAHGDKINYKKTFLENHPFDNIVLKNTNINEISFFPNGSDERQFSSPKIRIPTSSIMRSMYGGYDEYHTSFDNLQLIDYKNIKSMSKIYYNCLVEYEQRVCYEIAHKGCEPFLSAKKLYRQTGGTKDSNWDKTRNWVIFLSDGKNSALDMHKKTNIPIDQIRDCINVLLTNKVINVSG